MRGTISVVAVCVPGRISKSQPGCQWCSEGWVCVAQQEFDKLPTGQVGLIVYPWCIRGTRWWQRHSWRSVSRRGSPHGSGTVRRGWHGRFSGGRTGQRSHVHQSIRPGEGSRQVPGLSSFRQGNDHHFTHVSSSSASQTPSAGPPRGSCIGSSPSPSLPLVRTCRCGRFLDSFATIVLHVLVHVLSRRVVVGQRGWGSRGRTHLSEIWMCRVPMLAMLHGDGRPRRGAAEMDGVALLAVRRAKDPLSSSACRRESEGRFSEQVPHGWPRLVHGAKHHAEACSAKNMANGFVGCAGAKAVAASLLGMQGMRRQ